MQMYCCRPLGRSEPRFLGGAFALFSAARAPPGTQPGPSSFTHVTKVTLPQSPEETEGLTRPSHLPGPSISTATVEGSGKGKQLSYQGLRLTQMH